MAIIAAMVLGAGLSHGAEGDFVWAASMTHTESTGSATAFGLVVDGEGSVYTTGRFSGTVDFDPGEGVHALTAGVQLPYITKLDSSGALVWAVALEATGSSAGNGIDLDPAGNVYVTGYYAGTMDFSPGDDVHSVTAMGGQDTYVLKLDGNGNFDWARTAGGARGDRSFGVAADAFGVYTVGVFNDTVEFGPGTVLTGAGSNDVFVMKHHSDGTFLWARSIGGPSADFAYDVDLDGAGNVYFVGSFRHTVDFDPDSGIFNLIGSSTEWSSFVASLNTNGEFLWANNLGVNIALNSIAVNDSATIGITGGLSGIAELPTVGGTTFLDTVGEQDIFVATLDGAGNFQWASSTGGPGSESGYNIALDAAGSVYTTGVYDEVADFYPGPGTFELTPLGSNDAFVSKLDSEGTFQWAKSLGGADKAEGHAISTNGDGAVYVAGEFMGTVDFDPGEDTYYLTSSDAFGAFVVKLEGGAVTEAITVVSPNGGETLERGSLHMIAWTSSGNVGPDVRIIARRGTSTRVLSAITPNDGSYLWHVPTNFPTGNVFTIEVSSLAAPEIFDGSDDYFTVIAEATTSITVISPNGGETLQRGSMATIQWASAGDIGPNVRIIARKGASSGVISSSTPNDGSYNWTIPATYPFGPGMTIEISSVATPSILDSSDGSFTLTDAPVPGASITVLAPNGGETFVRGTQTAITWTSTGPIGENVRIIARKGNSSGVISNATPNDGSYTWTIPANYPLGPGMYIEISAVTAPAVLDSSDGIFTLINP